ncbi:MAG: alpha-galactosidase [Cyclobacteriaceae bacterium]|nr:alpha-galactosidase [Cyclobacteriaceae bacterium]
MNRIIIPLQLFFLSLFLFSCSSQKLPKLDLQNESARVFTKGDKMFVSTGKIERIYQLTSFGLVTVSLKTFPQKKERINVNKSSNCDWAISNETSGNLVSLNARISDDEKFTDTHISVEAEFEYPENSLRLKYTIWVYPGANGLRTQLQIKALPGFDATKEIFSSDITESLLLKDKPLDITAFGYSQGIKTNSKNKILTEEKITSETQKVDWANGLILSGENGGVILVKESNKSTSLKKEQDVATGSFLLDKNKISITGAGMFPKNLKEDKYLSCWANWLILYSGNDDDANISLKKFDRRRFPVHPDRDIFMMANTWGTEDMRPECLYAAREENVLKELESVAELGIDMLQIDDGWQTNEWLPAKNSAEYQRKDVIGDYKIYPEGWKNVKAKADKLGVKLGLWAAWTIPSEKLKMNYDSGKFSAFKLDFANLNTIEKRDELMSKARDLIIYSGYKTCVNWDVTETPPRAGYFYGREYGNVYLENRKVTTARANVQYVPFKVLRDAWLLSKYVNLNKFQVTVQNIDMTKDTTKTDAKKYNHPYVVGISLMASPIFFQETHFYSEKAKTEIKPILAVYKKHREEMYAGYVFPIGDEPDNKSWTGFQNFNPETNSGYFTIFRELNNNEPEKWIAMKFIKNKKVKITNLETGKSTTEIIGETGELKFEIVQPAGFLFLKYETLDE